ncbi:MAG: fused MFS/spermidine synthase [Pseudolabrys sp.]
MARSSSDPIPVARSERLVLGLFTAAVFLSALLLFGVQPMFSRMVLPQLGGSPSVWSVAMVFFQSMLLAGYAYAHFLMGTENRRMAVAVHLALLTGAMVTLPLSIADWGAPPASGTAFWLLGLFTVSIGLPFFALAANNPLLQTWFVRTGHREAHDPYFLYAASNIGSFLALLSYPLLLEPAFTLHTQGWLWSGGFVLLVALIAGCGAVMLRSGADAALGHQTHPAGIKPGWLMTGRWILVSTVPSGLLVAVTAHISTELTSAPLLWVMPLSLYLLTWVLVFQRKPALSHKLVLTLQPFAVAGVVALLYLGNRVPMVPSLIGHLLAFFIIALGCHGELARTRPPPAYLSSFYVSLSFGGMVGGLFAGLLAPYMFSWIAEYPILIALAALCRPWRPLQRNETWFWLVASIAGALVVFAFLPVNGTEATVSQLDMAVLGLATLSVLFMVLMRDARKSAAIVVLALIVTHTQHSGQTSIRSFFGVNVVFDYDKRLRILRHGSTIHGAEELIDGKPVSGRPKPLTYYHDGAPITKAIEAVRARKAGPLRVAVIGLGAGALACRIMPNETWRFFEIDPTVIDIARDPKYFTFVSACAPNLPIVLGDARLTMTAEPAGFYDVIVVDAYSSDAIPVHLATREAMAIYKSRLAPHGVVVMHISNRHLELESVATGIAAANEMQTWLWNDPKFGTNILELISPSYVAVAAERAEDVGTIATSERWTLNLPDPGQRIWTDDYSNIAGAFWRKLRRRWAEPASH